MTPRDWGKVKVGYEFGGGGQTEALLTLERDVQNSLFQWTKRKNWSIGLKAAPTPHPSTPIIKVIFHIIIVIYIIAIVLV